MAFIVSRILQKALKTGKVPGSMDAAWMELMRLVRQRFLDVFRRFPMYFHKTISDVFSYVCQCFSMFFICFFMVWGFNSRPYGPSRG